MKTSGVLGRVVGYQMRRANLHFIEAASCALARYEITPLQWCALARIEANPGCNQSDLGVALAINRSGAAKVVARLVALDLLERRPTCDPRAYALEITPEGRDVLAEGGAAIHDSEQEILQVLDEAEQRELSRLLLKLAQPAGSARAGCAEPAMPRQSGTAGQRRKAL